MSQTISKKASDYCCSLEDAELRNARRAASALVDRSAPSAHLVTNPPGGGGGFGKVFLGG